MCPSTGSFSGNGTGPAGTYLVWKGLETVVYSGSTHVCF
jgi:hypothetical protein